MDGSVLRKDIDQLIASQAVTGACTYLAELWHQESGSSAASFVVSRYNQLAQHLSLAHARLFILRSFTVEPVVPLLRASAFVGGIDLAVEVGDFNAYAQEFLDPASRLYRCSPDLVIVAVQTRDIAPDLWEGRTHFSTSSKMETCVQHIVDNMWNWAEAFRSRSQAHLIIHTLEVPYPPNQGILDHQSETGQAEAIRHVNRELCRLARQNPGVYILDYDGLVSFHGRARWHDEQKWLTMRMPIAADHLVHLAQQWMRFIHPLTGKICKALVTDLDNTIWGGIIGEDGLNGIQIGAEYPGAAFQALQRRMLDLYERGILLAICSKNTLADAMEVFEKHPGMLLRPHHVAALRINWNDKVQNLREIAGELNIGTDALAFLDDNPVERERVRMELPEVTVIDLPADPMDYVKSLIDAPVFERLGLSVEDRERGRYYAEQRQRMELASGASTLEDFYRSLRQEVEVEPVTAESLARVAQLTQKTNQFNLTTHRYTEQQIADMATNPTWNIYSVRVRDRFGDNGLVGVAITHNTGVVCEIDTFLLSCRVIGRTVETALLSFLVEKARLRGLNQMVGWFLPTKKNVPAKEFYPNHRCQLLEETDRGSRWSLSLENQEVTCPEWIQLTIREGA